MQGAIDILRLSLKDVSCSHAVLRQKKSIVFATWRTIETILATCQQVESIATGHTGPTVHLYAAKTSEKNKRKTRGRCTAVCYAISIICDQAKNLLGIGKPQSRLNMTGSRPVTHNSLTFTCTIHRIRCKNVKLKK